MGRTGHHHCGQQPPDLAVFFADQASPGRVPSKPCFINRELSSSCEVCLHMAAHLATRPPYLNAEDLRNAEKSGLLQRDPTAFAVHEDSDSHSNGVFVYFLLLLLLWLLLEPRGKRSGERRACVRACVALPSVRPRSRRQRRRLRRHDRDTLLLYGRSRLGTRDKGCSGNRCCPQITHARHDGRNLVGWMERRG